MQGPQDNPIHHHGLPDYSMMVLLVDDQAMIGEAVRRALSEESDIDSISMPLGSKLERLSCQLR